MSKQYCVSVTKYKRFPTREVQIGNTALGGNNPIRVQSMTTTDTMDTDATIEQSIRMIEAGCEYVRITAPSKRDALNLQNIKDGLRAKGYGTPLLADIHFTPNAAEIAAGIVEKVRINPGNFADKKKFETHIYSDEEYTAELERIREKFSPLVNLCKKEGVAMRIGTNHGSLSDRIMSRYGDTAMGMVESAMEFIRICESNNFYDIVVSMKASNPQVMVHAYRLFVNQMIENGQNYPLHLGVTEAGDGEDGRIKSAVGIGALLEDGLGDTVRVSLTEEPEAEIPVAEKLVQRYQNRENHMSISPIEEIPIHPFEYQRIATDQLQNIGSDKVPVVIADVSNENINKYNTYTQLGYKYNATLDKYSLADQCADFAYFGSTKATEIELPGGLNHIYDFPVWDTFCDEQKLKHFPLLPFSFFQNLNTDEVSAKLNFVSLQAEEAEQYYNALVAEKKPMVLLLSTKNEHAMPQIRRVLFEFKKRGIQAPVIFNRDYPIEDFEKITIDASADVGPLFLDGFGNGVFLQSSTMPINQLLSLSFGILQATRTRISKTEYISCPSCGRTLFDLQETTAMIRAKTNHLKGVKIGIMGCIVNGPGEMADADYGYVGSGPGKITLYKGQTVVKRQIPTENALDELINIIKDYGDWVDVPE